MRNNGYEYMRIATECNSAGVVTNQLQEGLVAALHTCSVMYGAQVADLSLQVTYYYQSRCIHVGCLCKLAVAALNVHVCTQRRLGLRVCQAWLKLVAPGIASS